MQYLKDDVRESIIKAALKEFHQNGYVSASMNSIAKEAKMTSGNIYRYFGGKEELFNSMIQPVYDQLMSFGAKMERDVFRFDVTYSNFDNMLFIKELYQKLLEVFFNHGAELLILMEKSENTKFSGTKDSVKKVTRDILGKIYLEEFRRQGKTQVDDLIISAVASAFIEGICDILKSTQDGQRVKYLVESFAEIIFHDLSVRM